MTLPESSKSARSSRTQQPPLLRRLLSQRGGLLPWSALAAGLLGIALTLTFSYTDRGGAQAAVNQMELDADGGTAGVQATRNVTGAASFSVGIQVTAAAAAYQGYQWEIEFPPAGLTFAGGVVENTAGTTGVLHSFNTAASVSTANGIRFTP